MKYLGNAEFNALISDEAPYIYTNGTVEKLHFEDRNGFILHDTLRVDGTYDGDVSGSFGIIRFIDDKVIQKNYTGNDFEVNNFLKVPEPLIQKEFSRIMSLKDGSKK